MRFRRLGAVTFSAIVLVLAACSSTPAGGGSAAPSAPADPCASFKTGGTHTAPTDWSKAKIGVVTDVGTLND